jgi:hypothetical protein
MQLSETNAVVPAGVTQDRPILNTISNLLTAAGGLYQQITLTDLNKKLIEQGKNPLTPAQAQALSPQINVGIAPDTQTMILYGAAGIGALFLITSLMKSR